MPKVEFTKDAGLFKKGDIVSLDGMIVVELVKQGIAKKIVPDGEATAPKKAPAKPKAKKTTK